MSFHKRPVVATGVALLCITARLFSAVSWICTSLCQVFMSPKKPYQTPGRDVWSIKKLKRHYFLSTPSISHPCGGFFSPPWETCEQLRRNSFASHRMNLSGHSSRIMREVFLFFIIEMLRLTIERKTNEQLESRTGRLFGLLARVHVVYLKNNFSCAEFEDVVFQFHIICNEQSSKRNQGKGERNTMSGFWRQH